MVDPVLSSHQPLSREFEEDSLSLLKLCVRVKGMSKQADLVEYEELQ
jgi:hypothetical protein